MADITHEAIAARVAELRVDARAELSAARARIAALEAENAELKAQLAELTSLDGDWSAAEETVPGILVSELVVREGRAA